VEAVSVHSHPRSIEQAYIDANPVSRRLYERQQRSVPGGITHASRAFDPFPLFITRTAGARKWDVDGHEYVDYWMGHGANLLGHSHPEVLEAIQRQMSDGLHAGGETPLAVEWAERICAMVPSAERVRFTASGSEATQMAIRLARTYSGKSKIVKFEFHYHGGSDALQIGITPPLEAPYSDGIPEGVLRDTVVLPAGNVPRLEATLERGDIAAVIMEPAGAFNDTVPIDPTFLHAVREVTRRLGVLLIFDEVVTGFRYAPGGAQEYFGVTPDLTALGKIVGGGLPAGVVAGREDIMSSLGTARRPGSKHVPQHGTWNANPLAAAAGVTTLRLIATGEPIAAANQHADQLRAALNETFQRHGIAGMAYGRSSIWKTILGEPPDTLLGEYANYRQDSAVLQRGWGPLATTMRQSMLLNGVDTMRTNGFMSAVHGEEDIERTVRAFDGMLQRLKEAGLIAEQLVR
jgi:glutamate-1-semialdehyde 2,1-aminomutase